MSMELVLSRGLAIGGPALAGFSPGEWEIRASRRGHGKARPQRVRVPGDGPVTLVLE